MCAVPVSAAVAWVSICMPLLHQDMTSAQLTSMLVGCAKLRHYDQQLCSLLAAAAVTAMPGATGAQVVQMAWALAHLKLDMPEVFAAAAQQVGVRPWFRWRWHVLL
jgi:hypothetical protein